MANTTREDRLWADKHRADEIHIHKRTSTGKSWLPLLLLIGVLLVGLFGWSRYKRSRTFVSEPDVAPRQELPGVPRPDMPAVPAIPVIPRADDTPAPKADETPAAEVPPAGEAPEQPPAGAAPVTEAAKCSEKTVNFGMNETVIDEDGKVVLRELAACLKANPAQAVRLEGRADQRGSAERNQRLSRRRAEKVANQLSAYGVDRSQITVQVSERFCEDADEECWQRNRTVTAKLPEE